MSDIDAFTIPPFFGNAIAFVIYYAVFLVLEAVLAAFFIRKWNWGIFLSLGIFLLLEVLGSVAYTELTYAPVTGAWYSLYVFAFTAAPTFYISSLHLSVKQLLQHSRVATTKPLVGRPSSWTYARVCLGIDVLSLFFTIIGAAYAGAKAHHSANAPQPGFDIMTAAMAIQLCSQAIGVVISTEITTSDILAGRQKAILQHVESKAESSREHCPSRRGSTAWFRTYLFAGLLFPEVILFGRTVLRAVETAGGVNGQIGYLVPINSETIILFVAILFTTVLHPAVFLQDVPQGQSTA